MTASAHSSTAPSRRVLAAGLLWMTVYLAVLFALKHAPPAAPFAALLALAPAPAFAWFVWCVIGALRQADELERRVNLEALAFAFPAAMLLIMTLGLLELAVTLPPGDWSYRHLWAWFPPLYGLGVAVAWQRYR